MGGPRRKWAAYALIAVLVLAGLALALTRWGPWREGEPEGSPPASAAPITPLTPKGQPGLRVTAPQTAPTPAPAMPSAARSDYAPYPEDPAARPAESLDLPEGFLQTARFDWYSVSLNPAPVLEGRFANLAFANPAENRVHLMLDLRLGEGVLVYRSGLIAPGLALSGLVLPDAALPMLASGENPVALTVYSFAVDTYESMGEVALNLTLRCGE